MLISPAMAVGDLLSQGLGSLTFVVVMLVMVTMFGGLLWVPVSLAVALLLGVAERRLINQRWGAFFVFASLTSEDRLQKPPAALAIVITGCSSGFGFRLATRLANAGVFVFAGVRREIDGEQLRKGTFNPERMHPLLLDVTNEQDVLSATVAVDEILSKKQLSLLGLVNNAGYGDYAPIEAMSVKRMKKMFDGEPSSAARMRNSQSSSQCIWSGDNDASLLAPSQEILRQSSTFYANREHQQRGWESVFASVWSILCE
jgi:hypothetical protein